MIIGAGLAGMIAAHILPNEELHEVRDREHVEHQALLRFRSSAVSDLTGIPFRRVMVRKGIWHHGEWSQPTIAACNMYALKVVGRVAERSIWNLEPCERWIPPVDFHGRLCDALGDRILWKHGVTGDVLKSPGLKISTAPLAVMAEALLGYKGEFLSSPIVTSTSTVPGSDVYQSVYYPAAHHGLYRATLSGDQFTAEWVGGSDKALGDIDAAAREVSESFGSDGIGDTLIESMGSLHAQKYGKLLPIHEGVRKSLIVQLTTDHNLFSLGRFATWRNILLDDIVHDAAVIKRLISASTYERHLAAYKEI
jgi:hypothetical protein